MATNTTHASAHTLATHLRHMCLNGDGDTFDVDLAADILADAFTKAMDSTQRLMVRELDYALHQAVIPRMDPPEWTWTQLLEDIVRQGVSQKVVHSRRNS